MKLIFCLDDNNGLAFNRRRQSRDQLLIHDLAQHINGERLLLSPYSIPLFEKETVDLIPAEHPALHAKARDYCFLECTDPAPYLAEADEVIIYRWNRRYPDDVCFTGSLEGFRCVLTYDFAGSSHEKITKEVWQK